MSTISTLDALATSLSGLGVTRVFGLPGGGSSALIAALDRRGVPFLLSHSETGAVLMASTDAEQSGRPSVVLTSLGPGASAAVNGVAHCWLDRVPMLVLTDRLPDRATSAGYHQWIDQPRLFDAVTKGSFTVTADNAAHVLADAWALAVAGTPGPVHVDVPGAVRGWTSPVPQPSPHQNTAAASSSPVLDPITVAASRPLVVAGLGARRLPAGLLAALAERLGAPVLTTYKAKGVIDETHPLSAGIVTGGVAELPLVSASDLIVTVGLDPVELLVSVSGWDVPRLDLLEHLVEGEVLPPADRVVVGDLAAAVAAVGPAASTWPADAAATHRAAVESAFAATPASGTGLHPWTTTRILSDVLSDIAEVTVDAGAHMLPVSQGWRTRRPHAFWISNGLSTMAYALPAAIARSSADPDTLVVACTGDGGLLMAAAELASVGRLAGRLLVVVFVDESLSLIRIKQSAEEEGLAVGLGASDWTAVGAAFGLESTAVTDEDGLRAALAKAAAHDGPSLVAVHTDGTPYAHMLAVLRG